MFKLLKYCIPLLKPDHALAINSTVTTTIIIDCTHTVLGTLNK